MADAKHSEIENIVATHLANMLNDASAKEQCPSCFFTSILIGVITYMRLQFREEDDIIEILEEATNFAMKEELDKNTLN